MAGRIDGGAPPRGAGARPVARAEATLVRHYHAAGPARVPGPRRRPGPPQPGARRARRGPAGPAVPLEQAARAGFYTDEDPLYAALRLRVLRGALHPRPADRLRTPRVWGLRLFTPGGGERDAALDRELAALGAPARSAFALLAVEELTPEQAAEVLLQAGATDPGQAVDEAARLCAGPDHGLSAFDPCAVRVQPTDLLRRRRAFGASLAVAALALTGTAAALVGPGAPAPVGAPARPLAVPPGGTAPDPARLLRVAADQWQHTARIDFSAWPARGDRRDDTALLGRALAAWSSPGPRTRPEPGTPAAPPQGPPQLLFSRHRRRRGRGGALRRRAARPLDRRTRWRAGPRPGRRLLRHHHAARWCCTVRGPPPATCSPRGSTRPTPVGSTSRTYPPGRWTAWTA